MNQLRLQLFCAVYHQMCGSRALEPEIYHTVTGDLSLTETEALEIISLFFDLNDDFKFLMGGGMIAPPPNGIDEGSTEPPVYNDQIAEIPISAEGARLLELAIRDGKYIMIYLTHYTFVQDVLDFIAGVERINVPPQLCAIVSPIEEPEALKPLIH